MDIFALTVSAILVLIGLVHFYWALGGKAGIDKAIPTLEGRPLFQPGRVMTFAVGLTLIGFAYIAYAFQFTGINSGFIVLSGWVISGIFLLRALGEFNAIGFFKKIKATDFAWYDTMFYSPLSLFISIVFGILAYSRI